MNANARTIALLFLCVVTVGAQQPNVQGQHYMTINGIDGPPFPIVNNPVRTALPAAFTIWGALNQPYAIFQGNLQTGSTIVVNSIVDLALNPFPVVVADGFVNPFFNTGPAGVGGFQVVVPPTGTPPSGVPIGLQISMQCLMGDPFNAPFGVALTAATKITTVQGPTVQYYNLGGDTNTTITPGFQIPFYGSNYGTYYLCSNGFLTFGSPDSQADYTPTDVEMNSGPPRISAFWCDLMCNANQVRITTDTNPGVGVPKWTRVDFLNVPDYLFPVTHNFAMLMRDDGYLEIIFNSNNASQFDEITGIGPGNSVQVGVTPNLTPQVQCNFVGMPAIASLGGPILPGGVYGNVNQSFFEWFGIPGVMPYYGNAYTNYYDMPGTTLHFSPGGSGALPAASNRYQVY